MPTSRNSSYVKCPFYKHDEKRYIACEGVSNDNKTELFFTDKNETNARLKKAEYMKAYCDDNYRMCLICEMLEAKYE